MTAAMVIKVVGFSDVERHGLNTVLRLSQERGVDHVLWQPHMAAPDVLFLDAQSDEARVELAAVQPGGTRVLWVGDDAPEGCWRVVERPLRWDDVLAALDAAIASTAELDLDLGFDLDLDLATPDAPDTLPPEPLPRGKRALIASASRDERLYWRARLALAQLAEADEAETAPQALELLRSQAYDVAMVDLSLPGANGWGFLTRLKRGQEQVPYVIASAPRASLAIRVRGWWTGVDAVVGKPADPARLSQALERV